MKHMWMLCAMCLCLGASISFSETRRNASKKAVVDDVSGQGYGMAGCGLGSILFGSKPGLVQIIAATFNGSSGSQTFGITSGTSNCIPEEGSGHAELFILANRDALEKDISRGNGEALSSLAKIMGCSSSSHLGTKLQSNYPAIFPSTATSADSVAESIFSTIRQDNVLTVDCGNVG